MPCTVRWRAGARPSTRHPSRRSRTRSSPSWSATYGEEHVGLLTGDSTFRPRAPVVVMTTEVLRNMLLAGSDLLEALHTVVLDEVHFLQDPYRGGVWEEVLVLSPPEIRFVCLSATVNNADELGGWLRSVRGDTAVIVERRAPDRAAPPLRRAPARGRRDRCCSRCSTPTASREARVNGSTRWCAGPSMAASATTSRGAGDPRLPVRAPLRTEMIDELDRNDMLPAIVFIFSRAACDDAVRQVLRDGVRLTDAHERTAIREVAERRVEPLTTRTCRARLRRVARGTRARSGRPPRRPGACLPRDGGGVLRRRAAQGGLRHRDPVARDQHAGALGGDRAVHQVRRRRAGHVDLGRVPPAHGPGGPPWPR